LFYDLKILHMVKEYIFEFKSKSRKAITAKADINVERKADNLIICIDLDTTVQR